MHHSSPFAKITEASNKTTNWEFIADAYFKTAIAEAETHWRKVISLAVTEGILVPTFSSALAYYTLS